LAHQLLVLLEQAAPRRVTDICRVAGGVHDVTEQDGGQHAIGLRCGTCAGEELLISPTITSASSVQIA
jgi:hypothetical protein